MSRKAIFFVLLVLGLGFSSVVDAQSRLVPTGRFTSTDPDGDLSDYAAMVDDLLLPDYGKTRFAFVVNPAFSGESSCSYYGSTSELVLRVAEENIWFYYFGANSQYKPGITRDVKVNEYRCCVPYKTAKSLYELFYAAVFSSSYTAKQDGLDGVSYELLFEKGLFTAEFWSPKESTNCHKLEEILEKVCVAVKENDASTINALVPAVTELTKTFKDLFPKDIEDHWSPMIGM